MRGHQIRHQPQHQHLAFGIAEAHVVFENLGSIRGEHQPGIEHAAERGAARLHGPQRRQHDLVHGARGERRRQGGRRRIGPHAAGIWSMIAVEDPLVILRRGERNGVLAIAERKERDLLADQEFLDHDLGAGRPDAAAENSIDCGLGFRDACRHHHALAGRQSVGLDHDRRALRPHIGLGGRRRDEALIGAGRNPEFAAQVLGEALRAFEPGRRLARAEGLDAGCRQIIDDTGAERRLRTHHHEVDRLRPAECDHGLMVGGIERRGLAFLGDAGIAGRADEPRHQRARRDFPGQRMLAATGPDEKDVHAIDTL